MFDDIKKDDVNNKVDDIFADSDKIEEATKRPQSSLADLNLKKPEINKENVVEDFTDKEGNKNPKKVLKTIILIFIILVIILVVAYIVYAKVLLPKTLQVDTNKATTSDLVNTNTSSDNNVLDQQEDIISNEDDNIIEEDIITNTSSDIIVDDNESGMEILKNIDTDSDGLSDYDETYVYKTDPNNLDSDSDILSDYDEINIFGTDPLLISSDQDTYSDGQEIMSGYNPLGDGKINSSLFKNQTLFIEKYPELASK
ncbi:MAG TPA: hypothetical protein PLE28_01790 [bacterium]|nr:hypothetical protein [bacterium]